MGCMDDYYLQEIGRYFHLPCDGLRTNHRQTHRLARVVRHGHPLPSSIHRNSWPGNRLQFNHVNKNKIHPFSMSSSYVNQGATVGLESDSINIKKKGREFLVDLRITIKVSPTSGFDAMLFALLFALLFETRGRALWRCAQG